MSFGTWGGGPRAPPAPKPPPADPRLFFSVRSPRTCTSHRATTERESLQSRQKAPVALVNIVHGLLWCRLTALERQDRRRGRRTLGARRTGSAPAPRASRHERPARGSGIVSPKPNRAGLGTITDKRPGDAYYALTHINSCCSTLHSSAFNDGCIVCSMNAARAARSWRPFATLHITGHQDFTMPPAAV